MRWGRAIAGAAPASVFLCFLAGCTGDLAGAPQTGADGAGAGSSVGPSGPGSGSGLSGSGAGGPGGQGAGAGAGSGGAGAAGGNSVVPTIEGCPVFTGSSPWNADISQAPLHPSSDAYIDSIGRYDTTHPDFGSFYQGNPIGIPYVTVDGSQPMVPVDFVWYPEQSDPGPYRVPLDAPVEGGPEGDGDRHVLSIDRDDCVLYELYAAYPQASSWEAGSGAVWDLTIDDTHPDTWTSADAAGLPIFPGLVRYDEVVIDQEIRHALRFTAPETQAGYVAPATHLASDNTDPNLPPMGLRVRMKASYDCSSFTSEAQVVCAALKKYGMFLADHGSAWYITGAHDPRWNDPALNDLKGIEGDAFEAVDTGPIQTY